MAASPPVNLLNSHISNMHTSDVESPGFVTGLVTTFLTDADRMFGELAQLLEGPFVDFHEVSNMLVKLKGCSSSVGARQVRLACVQLLEFDSQQKNRDEWVSTLARGRTAFDEVRSQFQTMIQLERQIHGF